MGMTITPVVSVVIDGKDWGGWQEIEVGRSIDAASGTFSLRVFERWPGQKVRQPIAPGSTCSITCEAGVLLIGYIDTVRVDYDATTHNLSVSGRDKSGDLRDSAATVDGPYEYRGIKIGALANKITAPFGIGVKIEGPEGEPFARFGIQPEESAWAAIERAARMRGLLVAPDGAGNISLTKGGKGTAPDSLELGRNILRGRSSVSFQDRNSKYVAKGQREANLGDTVKERTLFREEANDPGVDRYRPKVIMGETQGTVGSLKDRAAWQATVNAGRSRSLNYTVVGWTANGSLWRPNALVQVKDQWSDVSGQMLIKQVDYRLDDGGTTTDLELCLPDAYQSSAGSGSGMLE